MNEILNHSIEEHIKNLKKKVYSVKELMQASLEKAEKTKDYFIFLKLDPEKILKQAEVSQSYYDKKKPRPLEGIPISIKDNICEEGEQTTCASKILYNFIAPYSATVIKKLKDSGAILFGRTNMDEFAMGSSTENSAFGITKNPLDPERVPGGSSGGSAASVAAKIVPASLGSDTGGSIRQPASFCGVYGLKPTYGRVSRYGLVAFASSLDQIGPFARNTNDIALVLSIIQGYDRYDSTSHPKSDQIPIDTKPKAYTKTEKKKVKLGLYFPQPGEEGFDDDVIKAFQELKEKLIKEGYQIQEIQSQLWKYSIAVYYILATAEASSNLARYDGVRYGYRSPNAKNVFDVFIRSRTEGFGPEVKRRILLGTYVLSSGYYEAFYHKAQKARKMIREEYKQFFKEVDFILSPTSPTVPFKIGEKTNDPIAMYKSDILTISVNLAGIPAMNVPIAKTETGLPIGLQIHAPHFEENRIFRLSKTFEKDGWIVSF
ncbi:MAG: Asp-tRNA(Asn)/Glu-tRNA(Gln) amidotransferase subunit GatA [Leptospiraceae bacterium]|nr:Asp-tRNA(Asn)/Glu-tRNA(Gln) amidotransferase subunit GatA [Leptospiraceae bacterium]MDW7975342.1 Asp-tRNA(Asn)/Glu-tRNA(Gln) amidotransferase subunit GatA [Leptospiraceae bacterium]